MMPMTRFLKPLLAVLLALAALGARAEPASPESVERLLAVMKVEAVMDQLYGGMDQMMRQGMRQALAGKTVTPEQQRALDALPAKFVAVMREEMSWAKLKPQYMQMYAETFEQAEVDGLLAFYTSPTGQAMLAKMPVVMRKSVAMSQGLMKDVLPKITAAVEEAMREAKLAN